MSQDRSLNTSASLLIRIRDPQDGEAWDQFMDIYTSIVRDYCFQRRLQKNDIDDLVQDVMSSVAKAIRTFEYDPARGRFRAWLGTVTANKIKSFLAKQSRRNGIPIGDDSEPPASKLNHFSDPDQEWIEIFSERIFKTACSIVQQQVNETAWQCFEMSWSKNMPASDIADQLEIPVHLVYVNKSRVLKRLESEVRMLAEDAPIPNTDN